ncbi:MAG: hypothetical protein J6S67_04550 [Methanobrevibacter sp.]|nr:hypothetical protein [Methanobrevibacter sp.]
MIIKKIKYKSWKDLKDNAIRFSNLGYDVEVRGWDDISGNILTIKDYDFKDIEKAAVES